MASFLDIRWAEQAGYRDGARAYGQMSTAGRRDAPVTTGIPCLDNIAAWRERRPMNVSPCREGFCHRILYWSALLTGSGLLSIRQAADRPVIVGQHVHANLCRDATQRCFRMRLIFPITWDDRPPGPGRIGRCQRSVTGEWRRNRFLQWHETHTANRRPDSNVPTRSKAPTPPELERDRLRLIRSEGLNHAIKYKVIPASLVGGSSGNQGSWYRARGWWGGRAANETHTNSRWPILHGSTPGEAGMSHHVTSCFIRLRFPGPFFTAADWGRVRGRLVRSFSDRQCFVSSSG